jgi:hypothetical protein
LAPALKQLNNLPSCVDGRSKVWLVGAARRGLTGDC